MNAPVPGRIARAAHHGSAIARFINARGASLPGALALVFLIALAAAAHAAPPLRHSISFQGRLAGEQVVTATDDGRIVVDYRYLNNGRGPDLREERRGA